MSYIKLNQFCQQKIFLERNLELRNVERKKPGILKTKQSPILCLVN